MTLTDETTVGQLVVERPNRARIFEKLGIDYCCGGKKPLRQVCADKGLEFDSVIRELESAETPSENQTDWSVATLTALADHIEATHHTYLKEELPRLEAIAAKVADRHGPNHPELAELHNVLVTFKAELESHMFKEEKILFPLVRRLETATEPEAFHCGSIANPIAVMIQEHDDAGNALAKMREFTHDYTPPADACNTFRAYLDSLHQLEADMQQHVHKENNILFPRAIEAEFQLAQK